jgi:tetratricopeptide (TPR) repeat protein
MIDEHGPELTNFSGDQNLDVEEIEKMLEEQPDNQQLRDWLAFSLYTNNRYKEAIKHYIKLISLAPVNETYHYYLGNCYYKSGLKALSIVEWKKVLQLNPNGKLAKKCQEHIQKA